MKDGELDWKDVSISLAASNARLCSIALAADALALEVELMLEAFKRDYAHTEWRMKLAQKALDAYKITRSGT